MNFAFAHSRLPMRFAYQRSFCLMILLCFAWLAPALGYGQGKDDDKPKLPDPVDMTLATKDNVVIKATYWEPLEPSKTTVPIILLHGWEGKRQEFDLLGRFLQGQQGHMVISIDLRGHGGSTTIRRPREGTDKEINPDRMGKNDFLAMVYDVQTAKHFLLEKHIKGMCNIELLTLVGADMGAIVAMNFAVFDWTRQQVIPRYKNWQDVRALVLLSPPQRFKTLSTDLALKNSVVKGRLSTMIIAGAKGGKAYRDANSLHKTLERFHAPMPRDTADKKAWQQKHLDLFFQKPDTSLQGTKLLANSLKTNLMISKFIELRLANKAVDYPWAERERR